MIITPFSVLYSVIFGSIYLLFLKMTYRFLLRHNCYRLVLFFVFLTTLRYMFVFDLPLNISLDLHFLVSREITLFGKTILDFILKPLTILLPVSNQIMLGKALLITGFGVAAALIIRTLVSFHDISKSSKIIPIQNDSHIEEVLRKIQKEMNTDYDIKIVQDSCVRVPFVTGLQHPILHIGIFFKDETEIADVIKHELTHIMNHDNWIKFMLHLVKHILWWNPLINFLPTILDDACECRCDSFVTKNMKALTKLNYASMINKYSAYEVNMVPSYARSACAIYQQKDYIYQRVLTFLKPQSLKVFSKFLLYTALVLISIISFIFSIPTFTQRSYLPLAEKRIVADADNSYLLKNDNGSYSLYTFGMLISSDITDASHYNIPIREETE